MTSDLYFRLLMGHLIGDYLLQSTLMATTKGQARSLAGWGWCTLHCLIYSAAVCLCLWDASVPLFVLIFISHFPIDKFGLAESWSKLIRGRTFAKAMVEPDGEKRPFTISFTVLVYVVVDNTLHLLLMWAALAIYYGLLH